MDWLGEFERDGVVVVPQVFSDADLLPVIDEISAWVDQRARALAERGLITALHEDKPFETRYGYLFGQTRKMQNGLDLMFSRGKAMFRFLHNDALAGRGAADPGARHQLQSDPAPARETAGPIRRP